MNCHYISQREILLLAFIGFSIVVCVTETSGSVSLSVFLVSLAVTVCTVWLVTLCGVCGWCQKKLEKAGPRGRDSGRILPVSRCSLFQIPPPQYMLHGDKNMLHQSFTACTHNALLPESVLVHVTTRPY
ncbi:hypothetical protein GJAV_G00231840 [Gymnothorax javanicus]|nr:hypothetical protein GJAV_G00231840 [Gymnothorax javanicus]